MYRIEPNKKIPSASFNLQYSAVTNDLTTSLIYSKIVSELTRKACSAHIQHGFTSSGFCVKPTNSHKEQPSKSSPQFCLKTRWQRRFCRKVLASLELECCHCFRFDVLWVSVIPAHNTSTWNAGQHWPISSHRLVGKAGKVLETISLGHLSKLNFGQCTLPHPPKILS